MDTTALHCRSIPHQTELGRTDNCETIHEVIFKVIPVLDMRIGFPGVVEAR